MRTCSNILEKNNCNSVIFDPINLRRKLYNLHILYFYLFIKPPVSENKSRHNTTSIKQCTLNKIPCKHTKYSKCSKSIIYVLKGIMYFQKHTQDILII